MDPLKDASSGPSLEGCQLAQPSCIYGAVLTLMDACVGMNRQGKPSETSALKLTVTSRADAAASTLDAPPWSCAMQSAGWIMVECPPEFGIEVLCQCWASCNTVQHFSNKIHPHRAPLNSMQC